MSGIEFNAIYPMSAAAAAASGDPAAIAAAAAGNDLFPGMPVGASPVHRDVTIAAAGTYTLWDPGPGLEFVLASAFISTDTAMRVAIVDESDIQGNRPVDGYFGANGGASPNLVPVPYTAKLAGNRLRVVTGALGNVKVRVSGWTQGG
jgi:hypothetical protein